MGDLNLLPEGLPLCALCHKPVENVLFIFERFEIVCVVRCHGALEETVLPKEIIYAPDFHISWSPAFVPVHVSEKRKPE